MLSLRTLFVTSIVAGTLLTAAATLAETHDSSAWLDAGTRLTFKVQTRGHVYDLVVEVDSVDDGLSYSWEVGPPAKLRGHRSITAKALWSSRHLSNYFTDGEDVTMNNRSSVWLSRLNYVELAFQGHTVLNIDGASGIELRFVRRTHVDIVHRGGLLQLPGLYARSAQGHEMIVLDDVRFPLILAEDIGFQVALTQVD